MKSDELRALQAPLKNTYRDMPQEAMITLSTQGTLDGEGIACSVNTGKVLVEAGLYPAAGGDDTQACSGDMPLEALVALRAVATALEIEVRGGSVSAEGDLDFRGTLAVDKEAPVGFKDTRLAFNLDTDADEDKLATLLKLTERCCVIYQTLSNPPTIALQRDLI